jgi:hypothetical protein
MEVRNVVHRKLTTAIWAVPLAVGALIVVWSALLPFLPWKVVYWGEMRQGDALVSNIESFRKKNARLPNPEKTEELVSLGFEVRVGYYPEYRLAGGGEYEIEYYIGFDGPRIIYSSNTRQWHCELCD